MPTELFDATAYRDAWADMQDDSVWGFGHFLSAGIYEGRRIDGSEREGVWTLPLDSAEGQVHNWQLFWTEAGYPAPKDRKPLPPTEAATIGQPSLPGTELPQKDLAFIRSLFVPGWYAVQAGLDSKTPPDELLAHYLSVGIDGNVPPSPLFDLSEAARLSGAMAGESVMKAWLARRQRNWPARLPFSMPGSTFSTTQNSAQPT